MTLANFSGVVADAGLNVSFWWSSQLAAQDPAATRASLQAMPRVNSLFFPGGDGGDLDWDVVVQTAQWLREAHPAATVWVSLQEYDAAKLAAALELIERNATIREALHGVVYGPHVRVPLTEFVAMVPKRYPVRQYPDICHSLDAQAQRNKKKEEEKRREEKKGREGGMRDGICQRSQTK